MTTTTANTDQPFEFDVHDRLANVPEALRADGTGAWLSTIEQAHLLDALSPEEAFTVSLWGVCGFQYGWGRIAQTLGHHDYRPDIAERLASILLMLIREDMADP